MTQLVISLVVVLASGGLVLAMEYGIPWLLNRAEDRQVERYRAEWERRDGRHPEN